MDLGALIEISIWRSGAQTTQSLPPIKQGPSPTVRLSSLTIRGIGLFRGQRSADTLTMT